MGERGREGGRVVEGAGKRGEIVVFSIGIQLTLHFECGFNGKVPIL